MPYDPSFMAYFGVIFLLIWGVGVVGIIFTPLQRQLDMRHPWQFKGDRCDKGVPAHVCNYAEETIAKTDSQGTLFVIMSCERVHLEGCRGAYTHKGQSEKVLKVMTFRVFPGCFKGIFRVFSESFISGCFQGVLPYALSGYALWTLPMHFIFLKIVERSFNNKKDV